MKIITTFTTITTSTTKTPASSPNHYFCCFRKFFQYIYFKRDNIDRFLDGAKFR